MPRLPFALLCALTLATTCLHDLGAVVSFQPYTDTSDAGKQALVAALLAPNSGIVVDGTSIVFAGQTTVDLGNGPVEAASASFATTIDFGTANAESPDSVQMALTRDGILLTSGDGTPAVTNTSTSYGVSLGLPGDSDLDQLLKFNSVPQTTQDATLLQFTFTVDATVKSVTCQLMFGSDEFPEFANNITDAAAIYVDGVNCAIYNNDPRKFLSVSNNIIDTLPVFVANDGVTNTLGIEYDGVTKPATMLGLLNPQLATHTIKIVIADTSDTIYDSGLFIAGLAASTQATGGGIYAGTNITFIPAVPVQTTAISAPASGTLYTAICPSTTAGVAHLRQAQAGKPASELRAFAWDAGTQAYTELPTEPAGGLGVANGAFICTRSSLVLDFSGVASINPFVITLKPGWNFIGVPPMDDGQGNVSLSHGVWGGFELDDAQGIPVTDPVAFTNVLGTPGGDITTTYPFYWNGTAYQQVALLDTGKGYWLKNNDTANTYTLKCNASVGTVVQGPGLVGERSRTDPSRADSATFKDRGTPPPPPAFGAAGGGSGKAAGGSGCGHGSGFAFLLGLTLLIGLHLRSQRRG